PTQSCVGCDASLSFAEFKSTARTKNGFPVLCGRAREPNRSGDRYMAAHSRWAAAVGSLSRQVILELLQFLFPSCYAADREIPPGGALHAWSRAEMARQAFRKRRVLPGRAKL